LQGLPRRVVAVAKSIDEEALFSCALERASSVRSEGHLDGLALLLLQPARSTIRGGKNRCDVNVRG